MCKIDGCEKQAISFGWCSAHYTKWRRYGDPLGTGSDRPRGLTKEERFLKKVNKTKTCWLWTGKIADNGYGHFAFREPGGDPETVLAHRYAYELWVGPIPDGLTIDHVRKKGCLYKHCVRPEHLEPITAAEQNRRYFDQFDVCRHGHKFTPENTRIKGNQRICRQCGRDRTNAHYRRHHPLPPVS